MNPSSVVKEWVFFLPFRMQSVLLSSLRGYDQAGKNEASKFITRSIRNIVLNNADSSNTFISETFPQYTNRIRFLNDIDKYNLHFVMHTMHAIEIIGYKHPDETIRNFYLTLYKDLAKACHLNFETEEQLDVRLGFTDEEGEFRKENYMEELAETLAGKIPKAKRPLLGMPKFLKPIITKKSESVSEEGEWKDEWDAGTGTSHKDKRRKSYGGSS